MNEISLFVILNALGILFTILIIAFKRLPEEQKDDAGGWQGMAFIAAIISTIIWLCLAAASINLGYTQAYVVTNTTAVVSTGSFEVIYPNTWPFAFIYGLISLLPFVLIFYLWPETWRKNKGE